MSDEPTKSLEAQVPSRTATMADAVKVVRDPGLPDDRIVRLPAASWVFEGWVRQGSPLLAGILWASFSPESPVPPTFCGRLSWYLVSFASGEASRKPQGKKGAGTPKGTASLS